MKVAYKVSVYVKAKRGYKKESEHKCDDWMEARTLQNQLKRFFEGTERIVTISAPIVEQ